jgi:hypothetical protein
VADATRVALIAIAGLAGLTLFGLAARHLPDGASREDAKREWRTPHAFPHGRRAGRRATRQSPPTTQRSTLMTRYVSPRFVSWLAIGIAAAFLVVATAAYSLSTTMWLAFAISIGTLVVSAGAHEVSVERAAARSGSDTGERESRLAAAA